jgi:Fe-S oxidoreductase/nitrate reductase gamma subunit
MEIPSREIFGNIPFGEIIYLPALIVIGILVYAIYRRYRLWHIGRPEKRNGNTARRIRAFVTAAIVDGIIHRKFCGIADNMGHRPLKAKDLLPKEFYAGLTHFLIFFGLLILLIGTFLDVLSHYLVDFLHGGVYLGHALAVDIGGILAIIGVILAIIRRYVQKPDRLDNKRDDLIVLLIILLVVITGYIVEGLRIAATELQAHPDWAPWSPGGYLFALAFSGLSENALLIWHRVWWWLHVAISLGAMAYVALYFSRLWHIIVSPWNVYFRNLEPRGALVPIDIEKTEHFGASRIEDFTWKHLMDLDACTRCGRCQDSCPAYLSGKPLSPKKVIQDLKTHLLEQGPALLQKKGDKGGDNPAAEGKAMIGEVIAVDAVWNCTTCLACQEVCPVWIEPMAKVIEMRRNLVMEQALVPETGEGALKSLENRNHPWRGTTLTRTDWAQGLDIKTMSEDSGVDILFWVGCTEALEERSVKVAQAVARILQAGGVNFGILGTEETCCGDPARRMGNEYLFQLQAQGNIELFKNYSVKKIVTACPHCYNTLKYEYPQFGGNFEVIHHTDFIASLLKEGKLKPAKGRKETVTYHDSCYLGRYNNIYDIPRQILKGIPDINLVEMAKNKERAFCCGAGGGHLWLEEQKEGQRINEMRTEQAMATRAQVIATACPYCLQMFVDGVKTKGVEETVKVMDIAEIVAEASL